MVIDSDSMNVHRHMMYIITPGTITWLTVPLRFFTIFTEISHIFLKYMINNFYACTLVISDNTVNTFCFFIRQDCPH